VISPALPLLKVTPIKHTGTATPMVMMSRRTAKRYIREEGTMDVLLVSSRMDDWYIN
jgi:hypothetical protein